MSIVFTKPRINGLVPKNRIMRSATFESLGSPEGLATEKLTNHLCRLAKGGCGLIVAGCAYVNKKGRGHLYQIGLTNDEQVSSINTMISKVHQSGGLVALQLNHAGLESRPKLTGYPTPEGPSQTNKKNGAMSKDAIYEVIDSFIQAGKYAVAAGADGVQLHAAHGYLLGEFISPIWNKRDDEFGGDTKRRFEIVRRILNGLRSELPSSFPIMIKMNGHDFENGGVTVETAIETAKMAQEAGCDAIEVSGGSGRKPYSLMGDMPYDVLFKDPKKREAMQKRFSDIHFSPCFNHKFAKEIKKHVNIPVISVGGFRTIDEIETVLKNNECDMVSLSRPFLRQPDLVNQFRKGEKKVSCKNCNMCFFQVMADKPARCYSYQ
ncbi:oxidoreductase, FAD/FMN-binding family protein [Tritrichomonas foetus]|uniref:Oxidoreductase, FAD/FMN-binding family protein n=1 Tax=Tritrichomonas foetus TaxID=1144522 RepID=A0A1J4JBQ1_9EUKA|nr:oxidoreductase, FAD/FMN-binding family protein [Tritrichomonas foetus]|eukprot:OHS94869.1 oxidoreductase, FAD/FMN-binding family protein [Tritrichomonas foetus]